MRPVAEGRAIWIRRGTVEKIGGERIASICRDKNLNIVLPQIPWLSGPTGDIGYWTKHIDPMIDKAHDLGLEVHPWTFFLDGGSIDNDESLMQVHKDGNLDARLGCPANPETLMRNIEKETAILNEHEVDGLSLEDCFVYHTSKEKTDVCFCKYCKENAPESLSERRPWLRKKLTDMLREIRREAKRISPSIKISVAARSPYKSHSLVMSSDWQQWCKAGYLEFLAPMVYTKDPLNFERRAREAIRIGHRNSTPVYVGIGAHWDTGFTTALELASQVEKTRKLNGDGVVFFHLGGMSEDQWTQVKRTFGASASPIYRGQTPVSSVSGFPSPKR